MEENELLCNIAAIITKDILIDNNYRQQSQNIKGKDVDNDIPAKRFPLLESDDEAFDFFLEQQRSLNAFMTATNTDFEPEVSNNLSKVNKSKHKRKLRARKRLLNENQRATQPPPKKKPESINFLNQFDALEFERHLHMSKATFLEIFKHLREMLSLSPFSSNMPPHSAFSISVWKLSIDEHFEQIARKFHIPPDECPLIIRRFWDIISRNFTKIVRWPNSMVSQEFTLNNFKSQPHLEVFQNLFGIIALKRLDIYLESEDEEIPVILQVVCSAEMKIMHCFVELAQDYSFDSSSIGRILTQNEEVMPQNCFLIGNNNFPLRKYLMRPFESCDTEDQKEFNALLEKAAQLAEMSLNVMAQRFNALYALEAKDLKEVRKIVETICALHNLCIVAGDDYVERNKDGLKLNWANDTHGTLQIKDKEVNEDGVKRRMELMHQIIKPA